MNGITRCHSVKDRQRATQIREHCWQKKNAIKWKTINYGLIFYIPNSHLCDPRSSGRRRRCRHRWLHREDTHTESGFAIAECSRGSFRCSRMQCSIGCHPWTLFQMGVILAEDPLASPSRSSSSFCCTVCLKSILTETCPWDIVHELTFNNVLFSPVTHPQNITKSVTLLQK